MSTDLDAAWQLLSERRDQRLSVTDRTSFAVMTRLKLDTASTLDQDCKAMGRTVLPCSRLRRSALLARARS